jgi:quinol monooxygenase YgiN
MTQPILVISGEIHIDPNDFDAALTLIEPLVAGTRAEAGCLEYGFWVDPQDRGRIRVFEEWATVAHAKSEHYLTFLSQMASIAVKSVELFRYTVTGKAPL